MNRRFALFVLPVLALLTPAAQFAAHAAPALRSRPAPVRPVPPAPAPLPDVVRVALVTDAGRIEIDLDAKHAPATSANFLNYVEQKRLDGAIFYRVMRLAWGEQPNGLVQGGLQGNPAKVLKPVVHEPTSATGILHKAGAISMARFAPGTATADFSILLSDLPSLDANPQRTDADDAQGYAAFGHVAAGMDVVRRIYDLPLSATLGQGALKGQMLERPVRIISARRVAIPVAPPVADAPVTGGN